MNNMKIYAPVSIRNQKIATAEEKAEFVKRNREFLITPVDGIIPEEAIDKMVYAINNQWKDGGIEADIMLDDMYSVLKKAGYK